MSAVVCVTGKEGVPGLGTRNEPLGSAKEGALDALIPQLPVTTCNNLPAFLATLSRSDETDFRACLPLAKSRFACDRETIENVDSG